MAKKGKLDMQFVVDTSKPVKNMNELQDRVEELRGVIEGAPLGSAEFERLTAQLQSASSQVKVLEKNMEGLEPQQKAEAFLKMGEGIAGAFAVGSGAMALMGVDSENMEKLQVKVQSAIAIATGIRMMSEAALMAATAKRVIVEKAGMVATKAGILWTKGIALAQGAWAVVQGILTGTIVASTIALHALKAAIIATGIGALVIGVVSLVAAMASWFGGSEETSESTSNLTDEIDSMRAALDKALESSRSMSDHLRELKNAEFEHEKGVLKLNRALEEQIKVTDDANSILGSYESLQMSFQAMTGERNADIDKLIAKEKEKIRVGRLREEQLKDQIEQEKELLRAEKEAAAQVEADQKAASARYTKRKQQKATDAENLRKLENELLLLEKQDIEERAQLKREQDLEDELADARKIRNRTIRNNTLSEIQAIYDQEELNRKQKLIDAQKKLDDDADAEAKKTEEEAQADKDKVTDEYLEEIRRKNLEAQTLELEDVKTHYLKMLEAKDLTEDEKETLEKDYIAAVDEINKEYREKQAEEDAELLQEKINATIEALSSVLDAVTANIDARLQENENAKNREIKIAEEEGKGTEEIEKKYNEKRKKLEKRQKAIAASQAIIQTYLGATAAFTSLAPIPYVGPVLGGIAALAAIASGIANVRQIYAQDVGDGGGGGDVPSVSSDGGNKSTPKAAIPTTGAFSLGGISKAQPPIKTYVVTDELTNSQGQLDDIRQQSNI